MNYGARSRYTREAGRVHAVGYKQRNTTPRCPGAHRWWCPVENCPTAHVARPEVVGSEEDRPSPGTDAPPIEGAGTSSGPVAS